jgi:small-conductance mechanosensitive channel
VTVEEFLRMLAPILILVGFVAGGYILRYILNVYVTRLARKTKTEIDDIIIAAVKGPIIAIFLIMGINFALARVPFIPLEVIQIIPAICYVAIILIAAWTIIRASVGILKYYGTTRPGLKSLTPIVSKVMKILVYFTAFILILNGLGIDVTALVAGLGIGGIALAFALQETLSQFFAGMYLMSDRPIREGDYIRLEGGQEGYVVNIGWRSTRIRELPNNIIVVPNSKLAGATIVNYYMPETELAVLVQVGVSYDSDLEKVERVTVEVGKEVLQKVAGGVPEFEPFIRYHTFDDFSINFTVILRAKEFVDRYLLAHEFIKALHKRYKKEGIEIPFPIRTIYTRKEK